MNALVPQPLLVRPSTGVLMHTAVQANPSVPSTYAPALPAVFCQTLRFCRQLERAVTVAELAARMGHSPAVTGVAIAELASLDLVRLVRAPAWAERLRAWAGNNRPVPVRASVIKMLAVGACEEHSHAALVSLATAGPWRIQESPLVEIATTRIALDLEMLTLGVSGLGSSSEEWADVCRQALGAVVVTGTTPRELATAHDHLSVLNTAKVPAVLLVHEAGEDQVDTDVVRASVNLPEHTPLVVGDVHGRGACEALMDLCSALMSGGRG